MNAPCSSTQLVIRCFKTVLRHPRLYALPWLVAALMQGVPFLWGLVDMAQPPSSGWKSTCQTVTSILIGYAHCIVQLAFAGTAARGLGWRHQVHTLRLRWRAIAGCTLRQMSMWAWYVGKPLAVCWSITGALAAGAYLAGWHGPSSLFKAFLALLGVAWAQFLGCVIWGSCRAEARLMLSRALVLEGMPAAEAIRASQERSTNLRGWLLKALALTYLPTFCVGFATIFWKLTMPDAPQSDFALIGLGIILIPLAPMCASLPVIALMALTPRPPSSEKLPLAA